MARQFLDTTGMACPMPMLKLARMMPSMKAGDLLEIVGDCKTFDTDLKKWCNEMGKMLVVVTRVDDGFRAEIQF